jgi:ribonuclease E
MTTRMLIDARHPEETRVVVVDGNRLEEFDFEAEARKQIKGNIYLAKVTRVEPSLQAAFVDYGGNRHGFLAFSEIHPDYYQIPREDREALLREEQSLGDPHDDHGDESDDEPHDDHGPDNGGEEGIRPAHRPEEHGSGDEASTEALRRRRMALRRRYKIQEVIRRRQVMLVQVVKEERGNKGAALTTYLSLAGRYSVLMPNTAQGGGISRKIANVADRKRLKQIMADLDLPPTMGAIVRTAGLERTKTEIKRDFDYLTRLWDEIRTTTLASTAPALIYEDSDLIKRAIRDIYGREIDEVLVDGEAGYKQAKDFMKLLMPSHARKVQPYHDPVPLFQRAQVEGQLAALMNPVVTLRSGGYIVINSTEALVAVDVNSGRSTREYNIEETATKTNIEAAEEVARQLRLRDLAGLVVVDFIDMESNSNNRKVERALKDALKRDRARIQVGRISAFGLLEMSRQRLRTGVLEASTEVCPTCDGTGLVRTPASAALAALRLIEEECVRGRASLLRLRADRPVAVYMLNRKRRPLAELEERYGVHIEVMPDDGLSGARLVLEPAGPPPARAPVATALPPPVVAPIAEEEEEEPDDAHAGDALAEDRSERDGGDRRRKRRRRGGRDRDERAAPVPVGDADAEAAEPTEAAEVGAAGEEGVDGEGRMDGRKRRRRRRRGGRRDRDDMALGLDPADADGDTGTDRAQPEWAIGTSVDPVLVPEAAAEETMAEQPAEGPAKKPARRRKAVTNPTVESAETAETAPAESAADPDPVVAPKPAGRGKARAPKASAEAGNGPDKEAPKPRRARKPAAAATADGADTAVPAPPLKEAGAAIADESRTLPEPANEPGVALSSAPSVSAASEAPESGEGAEPPRRGWWQRTFGA